MLGCAPNVIDENKLMQKIESLDMTIFSYSGEKIFISKLSIFCIILFSSITFGAQPSINNGRKIINL